MTNIKNIEKQVVAESVIENWKNDPAIRQGFPNVTSYHDWTVAEMAGFSDSFFKSVSERSLDNLVQRKWRTSPKIRGEFRTLGTFNSYCCGVLNGKIRNDSGLQEIFTG